MNYLGDMYQGNVYGSELKEEGRLNMKKRNVAHNKMKKKDNFSKELRKLKAVDFNAGGYS